MFIYWVIRFFGFLISALPYSAIHGLGRVLGSTIFWVYRPLQKKAMSNLSIAFGNTLSEKERRLIARRSFQNLLITCLEFCKLKPSHLTKIISLQGPELVQSLHQERQGIVFLTGHQANWEILFLAINHVIPGGIAVGRPINNPFLYKWILKVRQMNGGKIILPRQAIKEGLKALKKGSYIGIVGDQAFPESDYSYPLFGTRSWLSPAPALLAYKTQSPIIVGTVRRLKGKYEVGRSEPLWPDYKKPMKEAVQDLMDRAFALLESNIKEAPDQWMWIHDRWKQQTIDHVKREYRYGFILALIPNMSHPLKEQLKQIYPRNFITFMTPTDPKLWDRDFRYQLILDFVNMPSVRRHYLKLGATKALFLRPEQLKEKLIKPECQHIVSI